MFHSFKEQITIGGLQLNFLVDGQDTEGSLVMFEMLVPPNAKVPAPHFHVEVDETLYVLEGTLTMLYNTETRQLNPGDRLFIKRGLNHGFTNEHTQTVRVLCALSPASIGPAYFRQLAAVINVGGPPDRHQILSIMKQYGLEPIQAD
ncbi:cupin domain-containing protein [Spirosoma oryzicola]|uniref:cupin domain-containing protein n=1 Tax=Spirosoma oryzicola TaxID=2898794 RepID=UPI001E2B47AD|nr:cupin domain-containing protein [Spirosoma oryzicola]UHG94605.1 cupin domain-containing protein [Spirosoma oryzicola]